MLQTSEGRLRQCIASVKHRLNVVTKRIKHARTQYPWFDTLLDVSSFVYSSLRLAWFIFVSVQTTRYASEMHGVERRLEAANMQIQNLSMSLQSSNLLLQVRKCHLIILERKPRSAVCILGSMIDALYRSKRKRSKER